jgi:hypothetical protein
LAVLPVAQQLQLVVCEMEKKGGRGWQGGSKVRRRGEMEEVESAS